MFLPRLLLSGLLLGPAFAGFAQTAAPQAAAATPAPRFYVGLGAYSSNYQSLGGQAYRGVRVPVQLTAGYQWRPRLAVQASVAYSGVSDSYANAGRYYPDNGTGKGVYFDYQGTNTARNTSVALLARYTLTRQPAHRLQFDLLGGFTLEHGSYRSRGTTADSARVPFAAPFDNRASSTSLLLTFGPSVRYRLGSRFELLYDFTLNTRLVSDQPYSIRGLTTASALGLRYRFGRR